MIKNQNSNWQNVFGVFVFSFLSFFWFVYLLLLLEFSYLLAFMKMDEHNTICEYIRLEGQKKKDPNRNATPDCNHSILMWRDRTYNTIIKMVYYCCQINLDSLNCSHKATIRNALKMKRFGMKLFLQKHELKQNEIVNFSTVHFN